MFANADAVTVEDLNVQRCAEQERPDQSRYLWTKTSGGGVAVITIQLPLRTAWSPGS